MWNVVFARGRRLGSICKAHRLGDFFECRVCILLRELVCRTLGGLS